MLSECSRIPNPSECLQWDELEPRTSWRVSLYLLVIIVIITHMRVDLKKKKEKKTQDLFFGVIMYRKFAICLGFGSSLVVRLVSGTLSRFHYIAKL